MKYLKRFNELKTQTYADIMNNTEKYPWVKFLGDKFKKSDKMKNVNKLANEHFTKKIMDEFKESEIVNGDKKYKFENIKFNSNWTNYDLVFKGDNTIYIKFDPTVGYYLGYGIKDDLDNKSKKLINDMFKYMRKDSDKSNESVSQEYSLKIADNLLPIFKKIKSERGYYSGLDYERYMRKNGYNSDVSHSVMNLLVDKGFDFDREPEDDLPDNWEDEIKIIKKN
jgi:hypothetical protein